MSIASVNRNSGSSGGGQVLHQPAAVTSPGALIAAALDVEREDGYQRAM